MFLGSRKVKSNNIRIRDGVNIAYSSHRTLLQYKCDDCESLYEIPRNGTDLKETKFHFCLSCRGQSNITLFISKRKRATRPIGTPGERRTRGKTRYIEVWVGHDSWHYKPETARRNGWIREHIYVMQEELGTTIPAGYVVHHIDGDKRNNVNKNLVLLTVAEHNNAHAKSESIIFQMVKSGMIIFNRQTKLYEVV